MWIGHAFIHPNCCFADFCFLQKKTREKGFSYLSNYEACDFIFSFLFVFNHYLSACSYRYQLLWLVMGRQKGRHLNTRCGYLLGRFRYLSQYHSIPFITQKVSITSFDNSWQEVVQNIFLIIRLKVFAYRHVTLITFNNWHLHSNNLNWINIFKIDKRVICNNHFWLMNFTGIRIQKFRVNRNSEL